MPEMNLKQPRPTYSVSGPFTKNEEGIQKFKETDWRYIYWNKQDKACFQHNFYDGFKDLPRKTASDKTLRDKAFNIAKNPKYDGFQRALTSLLYNFFFIKSSLPLQINLLLQVIVLLILLVVLLKQNYVKLTISKWITQANY